MKTHACRITVLAAVLGLVPVASFAQCDPLVVKYDGSNWWWGAFGNCKQGGGTTDRTAIFDCAWNQVPAVERLECLRKRLLETEYTRQAIDEVASFNGPPNSCDQLMRKYERFNWWWGAFGNCKQGGGTTNRDAIFECAWNQVPDSDRTACLKPRLRATEFTRQAIDDVAAFNGPPGNCDALMVRYDRTSNWWPGAFANCKGAGAEFDRDKILDCAWMQVPAPDQQACLKARLATTEETRRAIDGVAAANVVIASRFETRRFEDCPDPQTGCPESCALPTDGSVPDQYFAPMAPQELLEPPAPSFNMPAAPNSWGSEGRLNADLRAVARLADPAACSLHLSAIHYGLGKDTLGQAFADLAVTGRRAFAAFRDVKPRSYCRRLEQRAMPAACPAPATLPKKEALEEGCKKALDRAYAVANFLRTGQSLAANPNKIAERNALGWIAVSGEDDAPHRPVNVPSSDFPQFDIDVQVAAPSAQPPATVTVSTRYVIAQSRPPATAVVRPAGWKLRPEPVPAIGPNADVIVFVHGMDSRAEEATDITKALFGKRRKNNLVVISMDLPTSGYATTLDYDRVSPLAAIGSPKVTLLPLPVPIPPLLYAVIVPVFLSTGLPPPPPVIPPWTPIPDFAATGQAPLLDFIETFVVSFVDAVEGKVPIKNGIRAAMGGSLGGNISFRLGRRPDVPWLPATVVWSPASIWDSLGEGADILKHLGPRSAWRAANDRDPADPNDLGSRRAGRRAEFFGTWDKVIIPLVIDKAQSDTWASDGWPCKKSSIVAARLDRHETYDANFLAWHWRLGAEQLLYSHQSNDTSNAPRYLSNYKPMLLSCGVEDEVPYNNICSATQKTAPRMIVTPGRAMFLDRTGHSVDTERPAFFAAELDEFLGLR